MMPVGAVSVVVPTFREAGNLPALIQRLAAVRRAHDLDLELVICDDDSRDGTAAVVRESHQPWVRLLTRTAPRGIAAAVMDGLAAAKHDRLVVMHADLSHPPEAVPTLLAQLDAGADFVIGSRHVPGSSDARAPEPGLRLATLFARPFSRAADPLSGFFALDRATLARGRELDPTSSEIGLELLVKCGCQRVVEIPIAFSARQGGERKRSLWVRLGIIRHLRRLYIFKHPTLSYLLQFGVVGASGTVVNLVALTALSHAGTRDSLAIAGGIAVSFVTNFFLNRRFTFGYARMGGLVRQFLGFATASALGLLVNWRISLLVRSKFPELPLQVAALVGIVAGMGFNYATSRYLVLRKARS